MGVGRFFCVALPFILTTISLVCLLIVGLAGVTSSNLHLFEVAPKNLSITAEQFQNLDFKQKIKDAADAAGIDSSDVTAVTDFSLTASSLGLGDNKPTFDYASNFTDTTTLEKLTSDAKISVTIPDAVKTGLKTFATLVKWTEVVYIIACVTTALTVLVGIAGFFSRIGSCCTWIISGISCLAIIGFATLATVTSSVVVGALTASVKHYGVESSINTAWLAVIWIGAAASVASGLFWLFSVCCCANARKDNRHSRAGDSEKLLGTRGYQPVHDPYQGSPYMGQQSGVYNQQQHAIPMHNVKTADRAQAPCLQGPIAQPGTHLQAKGFQKRPQLLRRIPGTSSSTSLDKGPAITSQPSFSKSDTVGSTRSFKTLRSKIPGTSKTDSPRESYSGLSNGDNDNDTGSVMSGRSGRSRASRSEDRSPLASFDTGNYASDAMQPPPSPIQSASMASGTHEGVAAAQQSGEVDVVSDQPASGTLNTHPHGQLAGKSILVKKENSINPTNIDDLIAAAEESSNQGMGMDPKSIDIDDCITRLIDAAYAGKVTKGVCLKNAEITAICVAAREVFLSQPALLELDAPVKIVGDIHGQYPDLIRLFEMSGSPPSSNFLFLGDYVDRGKQSLETILLLLCYKLRYPENFFLLRGNHECANVTRVYGFYDECKRRCNIKIWKTFVDTFNTLPIAAIVAEKIFCVHGGLSPSLSHMDDIRNIARPTDVPDYGLLNDLLWSDPADMEADWEANERGVSYCFGKNVITQFLERHNFDLVCRAHMVVEDGYEFFNDRVLVTVFSAPNYCGEFDNWGAVMSVSSELLCSFELLKPLDSSALKSHIKKGRNKRNSTFNSPPANFNPQSV
ncbi:hypothetical protein VE04_10341 [Pseudogymnoascus sp. 24MN13]|nr:hypothetical protein VE04_10341 [Pseudogymnoascus sp. 24MN13]